MITLTNTEHQNSEKATRVVNFCLCINLNNDNVQLKLHQSLI